MREVSRCATPPSEIRHALHVVIRRLVPRAPLDVAADARLLLRRHGLPGEHLVGRRSQVAAGRRDVVAGTAGVELTAVGETALAVEQEEIRRARRLKRL